MIRFSNLATAVLVVGAAYAAPSMASGGVDVSVAYPYYGVYTTAASAAAPAADLQVAACPDPSIVYPYYGKSTTATVPAAPEQDTGETAAELNQVLAAYGRDQYLGL